MIARLMFSKVIQPIDLKTATGSLCGANAASIRSEFSKFQFSGSVIRACLLRGDRFKIDPEHHELSCCNPP
jgi:hypothetical protein